MVVVQLASWSKSSFILKQVAPFRDRRGAWEEDGIDMLWDLMQKIYEQEKMTEEWRASTIVPIYKEKGDIQDCGNYR